MDARDCGRCVVVWDEPPWLVEYNGYDTQFQHIASCPLVDELYLASCIHYADRRSMGLSEWYTISKNQPLMVIASQLHDTGIRTVVALQRDRSLSVPVKPLGNGDTARARRCALGFGAWV